MNSTAVLPVLLTELLEVEDLAAEVGLRLQSAGREPADLTAALADARAAAECLRRLMARFPDEDDAEPAEDGAQPFEVEDWPG
jgi:hypothetical protein